MAKSTTEVRRKIMQSIKGKDTKIEISLRKKLWKKGYRYRKNYQGLPGKPDIVFLKQCIAIFCDGEFWHGYDWQNKKQLIRSNKEYWVKKIEGNIRRDALINKQLKEQGWTVIRFWEKDIEKNIDACINRIEKELKLKN